MPAMRATWSACLSSGGTSVAAMRPHRSTNSATCGSTGGGGDRRDARLDEVPVVLEVDGHQPHPAVHPEAVVLAQLDEAHRRGVVEQGDEEVVEALAERDGALHLVEHVEARRQRGLHRELRQQPAGEGVQRAHGCVVEVGERGVGQVGCGVISRVDGLRPPGDELGAQPVAQLGGRLLGERDRGDLGDRHAGEHEVDDPPDERRGLAAAGAGGDEQRALEVVDHQPSRRSIGRFDGGRRCDGRRRLDDREQVELLTHRRPVAPSSSGSSNSATSRGSASLRMSSS